MNGHFTSFRQLVQKLERTTSIFSTLLDKQNEWSFYEFSSTGSEDLERRTSIFSTVQDKQNERSFYEFSSTGSKVRTKKSIFSALQDSNNDGYCTPVWVFNN